MNAPHRSPRRTDPPPYPGFPGNVGGSTGPGDPSGPPAPAGPAGGPAGSGPDGLPEPPKIGRPDGLAPSVKDAPEQVRDGVKVWYAVTALQLLTGILQLVLTLTDRRALTRQVVQQTKDMDLPDGVTTDTLVTGYAVVQFLLTLLSVVVCGWLVTRVGRGGYRSRFFLTLGSLYLALTALMQTFAGAPETGSVLLIVLVGAGTIVSGVLAPVGWWLLTRPETRDWFGMPGEKEMAEFTAALDRRSADLRKMKDAERAEKKAAKDRKTGRDDGTGRDGRSGGTGTPDHRRKDR